MKKFYNDENAIEIKHMNICQVYYFKHAQFMIKCIVCLLHMKTFITT